MVDGAHYVEDFSPHIERARPDSMCEQDYLPSSEDMWVLAISGWVSNSYTLLHGPWLLPICHLTLFCRQSCSVRRSILAFCPSSPPSFAQANEPAIATANRWPSPQWRPFSFGHRIKTHFRQPLKQGVQYCAAATSGVASGRIFRTPGPGLGLCLWTCYSSPSNHSYTQVGGRSAGRSFRVGPRSAPEAMVKRVRRNSPCAERGQADWGASYVILGVWAHY